MNACHVIGICCCQAMIAGSLLLSGCGPSSAEQERLAKLANVKKVALVGFVGKSSVSPGAVTYKRFTDKTFAAFQRAASSAPPVVELIPVRNVVENDSYKAVSKIKMPDGAYSPIGGLTYISQGAEKGFDCGPLVQALGVDALLIVVIDFGIAIRNNGSDFFLVGKVESHLVSPPEESLWKAPSPFEEQILISIVDHPKLVGSIGAKWVVMARPSAEEYAELMQIAEERKTKVPQEIGTSLVSSLVREIKKAREYARSSAPK